MPASVVYEDDEIQVIHRPGSHEGTLIAFSAILLREGELWYWGSSPAETLDLNVLSFTPKRKNYFPYSSVLSASVACRDMVRGNVVQYGASMGGYAALKYSGIFNATCSIAFSPQHSVNPHDAPFDLDRHIYFIPSLHREMSVGAKDLSGQCLAIFDPYHPVDSQHASILARQGVTVAPIRFCGHDVINVLVETKSFGDIYKRALVGDVTNCARIISARRRRSKTYLANLARHLARRNHLRAAASVWSKAVDNGFDRAIALCMEAEESLAHGKKVSAIRLARASILATSEETSPDASSQAASILSLMQDYRWAVEGYNIAFAKDPRVNKYIMGLTYCLDRLSQHTEMIHALEKASLVLPNDAELWGRLGWAYLQVNKKDKAVTAFDRAISLDSSIDHFRMGAEEAKLS